MKHYAAIIIRPIVTLKYLSYYGIYPGGLGLIPGRVRNFNSYFGSGARFIQPHEEN